MRPRVFTLLIAVLMLAAPLIGLSLPPNPFRFDFDSFPTDGPPPRFSMESARGVPPSWLVMNDATAPSGTRVLLQTNSAAANGRYRFCVYDGLLTHNVVMSVRFKPVSGSVARTAGLIARFQDNHNYWVLWADAIAGRVGLSKILEGAPHEVASSPARFRSGSWHTLQLAVTQKHFEGSLDGERLVTADDMSVPEAGEVGLWTKSDAAIAFDDFIIEESDAGH